MSKKKYTIPPMASSDLARHRKESAQERQRRGFVTFTRASVREQVMGRTEAENTLQKYHRQSQITGRRPVR